MRCAGAVVLVSEWSRDWMVATDRTTVSRTATVCGRMSCYIVAEPVTGRQKRMLSYSSSETADAWTSAFRNRHNAPAQSADRSPPASNNTVPGWPPNEGRGHHPARSSPDTGPLQPQSTRFHRAHWLLSSIRLLGVLGGVPGIRGIIPSGNREICGAFTHSPCRCTIPGCWW